MTFLYFPPYLLTYEIFLEKKYSPAKMAPLRLFNQERLSYSS